VRGVGTYEKTLTPFPRQKVIDRLYVAWVPPSHDDNLEVVEHTKDEDEGSDDTGYDDFELKFLSYSIHCESCDTMYYCCDECKQNHHREFHSKCKLRYPTNTTTTSLLLYEKMSAPC